MVIKSNFIKRCISALVLGYYALAANYYGGWMYIGMLLVIFALMLYESITIIYKKERFSLKFIEFSIVAVVYSLFAMLSLIHIRQNPDVGYQMICFLFGVVWATDAFAYIGGSLLKGRKLAPKISPSKTISGFVVGVTLGAAVGIILLSLAPQKISLFRVIPLSFIIAVSSQIGDLIESAFKRKFDVKDSGNIIPGHGGVLDRVDGLVFASIVLSTYLSF